MDYTLLGMAEVETKLGNRVEATTNSPFPY